MRQTLGHGVGFVAHVAGGFKHAQPGMGRYRAFARQGERNRGFVHLERTGNILKRRWFGQGKAAFPHRKQTGNVKTTGLCTHHNTVFVKKRGFTKLFFNRPLRLFQKQRHAGNVTQHTSAEIAETIRAGDGIAQAGRAARRGSQMRGVEFRRVAQIGPQTVLSGTGD